jgi:hypothetical protein
MAAQLGFFDLADRYEALNAAGDPLERLAAVVDFEIFRGPLVAALRRSARGKSGRPPFDPVLMFKILVLQALYSLSDDATEFQIKDRLSFQRFLGLGPEGTVPDATTVWLFRERLVKAKAIDKLFARFDASLNRPLTRRSNAAFGLPAADNLVSGGCRPTPVVPGKHCRPPLMPKTCRSHVRKTARQYVLLFNENQAEFEKCDDPDAAAP